MKLWQTLKQLVITSRPTGWILFAGTFFVGLVYSNTQIGIFQILHLLLFTFPACLICFGLNDVADYPYDLKNPRKKSGWSGSVLDKKYHKLVIWLAIIFSGLLLIPPILNKNGLMFVSTVITIFISYSYSHKPFRFKSIPGMELFCNVIGTFALILIGFSHGGSLNDFVQKAGVGNIVASTSLIIAISLQSYLADYLADKEVGEKNLVQLIGQIPATILAASFYGVAALTVEYSFLRIVLFTCLIIASLPVFFERKNLHTLTYYFNLLFLTISFLTLPFIQ